jgi:hypothetical protein
VLRLVASQLQQLACAGLKAVLEYSCWSWASIMALHRNVLSVVLYACACRLRVTDDVADAELLKSFELSRQKYKKRKEQVGLRDHPAS